MSESIEPIAVDFPISGEWCAVNTPGYQIPSHGTDQLGQRYAYDFLQIDWNRPKGYKFHRKSTLQYITLGVALHDTFCWSQSILSPFSSEIVEVKDGCQERNPVHLIRDLSVVLKNAFIFTADSNEDLHSVLGNYIILKGEKAFALIAHARCGSIQVNEGDQVVAGQQLAKVGHSGNSTAPHLHFQLMDRKDLIKAEGLPCCFRKYETYQHGQWKSVTNGIPGRRERIKA